MNEKVVLVLIIGTADTKADELMFLKSCVQEAGADAAIMDIGILGTPPFTPEYSKHDVAAAANTSNEAIIEWVRLFWNGGFGMSHSGKGSSHLTRLRWRPLTGTTLPSA